MTYNICILEERPVAKFRNIPQFTVAQYRVDIPWNYVEGWISKKTDMKIDLNPDFQRGHVWTEDKQIKYVEFVLRNGRSGRDIFWNCPGWMDTFEGGLVLVDGKQRIEAVRRFMDNEIPAFGCLFNEYEDSLSSGNASFTFHVNNLKTRKQVLQWYLDLNGGGVIHTEEELSKVRDLLKAEA